MLNFVYRIGSKIPFVRLVGLSVQSSYTMTPTCLVMSQVFDAQDSVLVEVCEVLDLGKLRVLLHVGPKKWVGYKHVESPLCRINVEQHFNCKAHLFDGQRDQKDPILTIFGFCEVSFAPPPKFDSVEL